MTSFATTVSDDVLGHLLSFLTEKEEAVCSLTCKRWLISSISHGMGNPSENAVAAVERNLLNVLEYLFSLDSEWNFDRVFYTACCHGRVEIGKWLVSHGTCALFAGCFRYMHGACVRGHLTMAWWLKSRWNSLTTDSTQSLLVWVCANGHLPVAEWLVSNGGNQYDGRVIEAVIRGGSVEIAEWIGLANIIMSMDDSTMLNVIYPMDPSCVLDHLLLKVVRFGHVALSKWLLEHGATFRNKVYDIVVEALLGGYIELVTWLISSKYVKREELPAIFVKCCDVNNIKLLDHIYSLGVDLHEVELDALTAACIDDNLETVQWLAARGADISNLLYYACEINAIKIAKWSVSQGADIHTRDDAAFRISCKNSCYGTIKWLLSKGADIHAKEDEAFRVAIWEGYRHTAKYLLDRGANIHAKEDWAVRYYCRCGYLDATKWLISRGADIHVKGDEALLEARRRGEWDLVNYIETVV